MQLRMRTSNKQDKLNTLQYFQSFNLGFSPLVLPLGRLSPVEGYDPVLLATLKVDANAINPKLDMRHGHKCRTGLGEPPQFPKKRTTKAKDQTTFKRFGVAPSWFKPI